jgi:cbb3-type cytochrome c oxidase subunit III
LDLFLRILILLLSLAALPCLPVKAGQTGCLTCHTGHYRERGGCVACHRGNDRTERRQVAHDGLIPARFAWFTIPGSLPVTRGQRLNENFACRRCHIIAGKGNRLAANLDAAASTRPPRELAHAIQSPVPYMPGFRFTDQQVTDLVNALLAAAAPTTLAAPELPLVVHFQDTRGKETIFEKRCGSCHRALTARNGALGTGDMGPNLSGLFSPFYPDPLGKNERWSAIGLRRWLTNPRQLREHALMRPVPLSRKEFADLTAILRDD